MKKSILTTLSAIAAGIFGTLCCTIPAILIIFGVSSFSLSFIPFFEKFRLLFLVMAVLFLGFGFYNVYFKKEICEDGECKRKISSKFEKISLWTGTFIVAFLFLFSTFVSPKILQNKNGRTNSSLVSDRAKNNNEKYKELNLLIKGMTCESCALRIEHTLKNTEGIKYAEVSFENNRAKIIFDPKKIKEEEIIKKIKKLGYKPEILETIKHKENKNE